MRTDRIVKCTRQFIALLSFFNLAFLGVWNKINSPYAAYNSNSNPANLGLSTIIIVITLTCIAFLLTLVMEKHGSAPFVFAFIAVIIVIFSLEALAVRPFAIFFGLNIRIALAVSLALILAITWLFRRQLGKILVGCLLIASPFFLFTLAKSVALYRQSGHYRWNNSFRNPQSSKSASQRVVWIIFDELDEHTAFVARPSNINLPNFDAFAKQAIVSENAFPPASRTDKSIPSLLVGTTVTGVVPSSPSELLIQIEGQEGWKPLSKEPTIFDDVSEHRSAVIGWYHPYCRLFPRVLLECRETGGEDWLTSDLPDGLFETTVSEVNRLGLRIFRNFRKAETTDERAKRQGLQESDTAIRHALGRDDLSLVFIHAGIPHPPGVYDRKTSTWNLCCGTYLDNLVLTDSWFGQLRQEMIDRGIWDASTVIVTSDHWWRTRYWRTSPAWTKEEDQTLDGTEDHRVPFLIKLPGQRTQFVIPDSFNTVITRSLIEEILKSPAITPAELAAWISNHSRFGERRDYDKVW